MNGCKKCPAYAKCTETYRGSGCAALRYTYGLDGDPKLNCTDREKLIELIGSTQYGTGSLVKKNFQQGFIAKIADHLLANGVTFAKDIGVPSKWIDVNVKLPALIPCGAGTAYSEAVNILTSRRKVLTAIWDGTDFISDAEFWDAEGEKITHWTPVPLPLPDPPEEQNEEKEIY